MSNAITEMIACKTMTQPLRIAMWSGPRNISTALMRAWENRPDCTVCDEPLYAHYLDQTGLDHPAAAEVIASQPTQWRTVTDWLTGPIPEGKTIFYQKQMAHHLLPQIELDWLDRLTNCFLIRRPSEMITSLIHFIPRPTLEDTGLPQQWRIFEHIQNQTGRTPPVLDSRDVLENPRGLLLQLCQAVGVEFCDAMLSWPTGRRATDGVWAKHWYKQVEQTTGFAPYREKHDPLPEELVDVVRQCDAIYERLHEHRLGGSG